MFWCVERFFTLKRLSISQNSSISRPPDRFAALADLIDFEPIDEVKLQLVTLWLIGRNFSVLISTCRGTQVTVRISASLLPSDEIQNSSKRIELCSI